MPQSNLLGEYLRKRRTALNPAAFDLPASRRPAPGLRHREVARRASISAEWYADLEQGRGGIPSVDVLRRLARALKLTEAEHEHLLLLGLERRPKLCYRYHDGITPRLQRLLEALTHSPALVRTAAWDLVAWNHAAATVLTASAARPLRPRNLLRMMFCDAGVRATQPDWQAVARFLAAAVRSEAACAGVDADVAALAAELCRSSPEFAALWRDPGVQTLRGGVNRLHHPALGSIALEHLSFPVKDRPDLSLVVYNPATLADRALIASLVGTHTGPRDGLMPVAPSSAGRAVAV